MAKRKRVDKRQPWPEELALTVENIVDAQQLIAGYLEQWKVEKRRNNYKAILEFCLPDIKENGAAIEGFAKTIINYRDLRPTRGHPPVWYQVAEKLGTEGRYIKTMAARTIGYIKSDRPHNVQKCYELIERAANSVKRLLNEVPTEHNPNPKKTRTKTDDYEVIELVKTLLDDES